jgi:hypothetical protein
VGTRIYIQIARGQEIITDRDAFVHNYRSVVSETAPCADAKEAIARMQESTWPSQNKIWTYPDWRLEFNASLG